MKKGVEIRSSQIMIWGGSLWHCQAQNIPKHFIVLQSDTLRLFHKCGMVLAASGMHYSVPLYSSLIIETLNHIFILERFVIRSSEASISDHRWTDTEYDSQCVSGLVGPAVRARFQVS